MVVFIWLFEDWIVIWCYDSLNKLVVLLKPLITSNYHNKVWKLKWFMQMLSTESKRDLGMNSLTKYDELIFQTIAMELSF